MFEIASKMNRGKVVFSETTPNFDIDLEDIKSRITKKTKLIFLCNPNNPTGRIIPKKAILDLIKNTKVNVIVDEANIEFGGTTVIKETKNLSNLIVLRTFSKGFGLAGFRIGFCATNQDIIQLLQKMSQPFPVSTVAEKVALAAFADTEFIDKSREFIRQERNFLTSELTKRGFKVIKSRANNLLIIIPTFLPNLISKLSEKGISVVDNSSFNLDSVKFMRISPRKREINMLFLKAIDNILANKC